MWSCLFIQHFYGLNHSFVYKYFENLKERELMVYQYNCNSNMSITSISFHKKRWVYAKHHIGYSE